MTELEFKALAAQGYNRIPVMLQTLADLDSPLGLYLKLTDSANRRNSFLLESVVGASASDAIPSSACRPGPPSAPRRPYRGGA